jgi:hypothetical protein
MYRKIILAVWAAACIWTVSAGVPLVRSGKAAGEIVIPAEASAVEKFAAAELRHWIKEITGADLPVTARMTEQENTKILLGKSFAGEFKDALAQLDGSDGYAFRTRGNRVYIFGAADKGTLNGVFRFIEVNSDLIWARPRFTVFTRTDDFSAGTGDVTDRPASRERGWIFTIAGQSPEDCLWQVRNNNTFLNHDRNFSEEWGMKREIGGHIFSRVISHEKYFASNPEYFPVLRGMRQPKSWCLCLSARDLPEVYFKELCAYIDKNMPMSLLKLGVDDSWNTCECPECTAPFKLPDGTVISPDDPAYRSTRWYAFVNPIADKVHAKYGIDTLVYTYIYLDIPPKIKVSDHILLSFSPISRDLRVAYEDYQPGKTWGKDSAAQIKEFARIGKQIRLREYYGCNGGFPRPDEYVARKDSIWALKNGVTEFCSEHPVDKLDKRFATDPSVTWDADAVTVWTINRLWWNPDVDLETLRDQFLNRTYREAAPAMRKYYQLIRTLYLAKPQFRANYQNTLRGDMKRYVIEAGKESEARKLLEEAEKAAKHPVSLQLVKQARANFELGCNAEERVIVKKVAAPPEMESPLWLETTSITDFDVMQHSEIGTDFQMDARMLHDGKNLYVKIEGPDFPSNRQAEPDRWLPGNFITLHLAGLDRKGYYLFGFDWSGGWFDAERLDLKWNSGMKIQTGGDEKHRSALLTIPLIALKFQFDADLLNRIYGVIHCRYTGGDGGTYSYTSYGLVPGAPRFFKEIYLEK